MRKIMIATAVAALAAGALASEPASAAPYGSFATVGAAAGGADMTQVRYRHYRYGYRATHYGGGARGEAGQPLGRGTANSPGGIIGGGAGAQR